MDMKYIILDIFQAQSDDDDVADEGMAAPAAQEDFMTEFFAEVSLIIIKLFYYLFILHQYF